MLKQKEEKNLNTSNFLGFNIFSGSVNELAQIVEKHTENKRTNEFKYLSCLNPHSIVISGSDAKFSKALVDSNWLIPDGIGLVFGLRALGFKCDQRIAGYDIFYELSVRMNCSGGKKVFFLGSTQETLNKIVQKYNLNFPKIEVVGTLSPPFKNCFEDEDKKAILQAVNSSGADVLWVGLSSPKQDIWMHENSKLLSAKLALGIGAVFDFYVGNIRRGPSFVRKLGLEWLYRLFQEPRRLWRRTVISVPLYVNLVIIEYISLRYAKLRDRIMKKGKY